MKQQLERNNFFFTNFSQVNHNSYISAELSIIKYSDFHDSQWSMNNHTDLIIC